MRNSWTKNAFWGVYKRDDVKCESLYHFSFLITLMAYVCSKRIPNVQMKYFMADCFIYRPFVINTWWKLDSLQIKIYLNVCSTWSMAEVKTSFETWITWNDVKGVSLIHLLYVMTLNGFLMFTMDTKRPNEVFYVKWLIYRLFVLNRSGKLDYLQIMIFVYVCSTWGIVEL
jgi:hypothetical protein